MKIEPREYTNDNGVVKKSVVIICETEEEQKILDTIGSPRECEKYDYRVYGELRLADGHGEFYVGLENHKYDYFRHELEFLGDIADSRECEGIQGECLDMPEGFCPCCMASDPINEAGEVLRDGINALKRKMKEKLGK